jgi:hypothetical protein
MRFFAALPLLLVASLLASPVKIAAPLEEPGGWKYRELEIEGWTVLVEQQLYAKTALRTQVLDLMKIKLWEIATRLPAPAVTRLRQVKLRMHLAHAANNGAAYHPSADWLREHAMPEDWALGIEFGNAENFLGWSQQQPAMVLHELAHAWHHQVLGYAHEGVLQSFAATRDAGKLEEVLYVSGGSQRAYALNNDKEFFAEMSEAWWSTNDMYPFVRGELLDGFPDIAKHMDAWWQLPIPDSQ